MGAACGRYGGFPDAGRSSGSPCTRGTSHGHLPLGRTCRGPPAQRPQDLLRRVWLPFALRTDHQRPSWEPAKRRRVRRTERRGLQPLPGPGAGWPSPDIGARPGATGAERLEARPARRTIRGGAAARSGDPRGPQSAHHTKMPIEPEGRRKPGESMTTLPADVAETPDSPGESPADATSARAAPADATRKNRSNPKAAENLVKSRLRRRRTNPGPARLAPCRMSHRETAAWPGPDPLDVAGAAPQFRITLNTLPQAP